MTSTDIVKWRKTNDYENFEKGMIYMIILKKGGSREKVEEETKYMPHAPVSLSPFFPMICDCFVFFILVSLDLCLFILFID